MISLYGPGSYFPVHFKYVLFALAKLNCSVLSVLVSFCCITNHKHLSRLQQLILFFSPHICGKQGQFCSAGALAGRANSFLEYVILMTGAETKQGNATTESSFKPLFELLPLTSHWSKQVTRLWSHPTPRGKEERGPKQENGRASLSQSDEVYHILHTCVFLSCCPQCRFLLCASLVPVHGFSPGLPTP